MRFYDFMTLVWAALWATLAGFLTLSLADDAPTGPVLSVIAFVGMATCVVFWRMYKDPG